MQVADDRRPRPASSSVAELVERDGVAERVGSRKLSIAHSSRRLFCSGVPG